jgi:dTDP-4-amino-4,6-dideoxygalactose transaminase
MVGATPVLVDIEDEYFTMDPQAFEQAVLDRQGPEPIRAAIPVHLYGQAAAMDRILAIARRHDIRIVEDCAQSHGASFEGRRLGSLGDVAAYSLYPTKNLGALGDGGIVTAADAGLAADLGALRQYGWRDRYVSDMVGVNSRLDEVQAALLRVRLRHLDEDNRRRQAIAAIYDEELAGCDTLRLPARRQGASHVFHQYVVRTQDRDGLQQRLRSEGIGTNVHYPVPVHLQPAYKGRIAMGPGSLRYSEAAARSVLSLPMFPQLTDEQAREVGAAVRRHAG